VDKAASPKNKRKESPFLRRLSKTAAKMNKNKSLFPSSTSLQAAQVSFAGR